nr:MAG TPA: hypothetical protein [Caudoviricetes sp.]
MGLKEKNHALGIGMVLFCISFRRKIMNIHNL